MYKISNLCIRVLTYVASCTGLFFQKCVLSLKIDFQTELQHLSIASEPIRWTHVVVYGRLPLVSGSLDFFRDANPSHEVKLRILWSAKKANLLYSREHSHMQRRCLWQMLRFINWVDVSFTKSVDSSLVTSLWILLSVKRLLRLCFYNLMLIAVSVHSINKPP